MSTHRFERGQALVLIVLAIVAMFGFAALAVDIGRLYSERRRIQNAADSAALAAAFAASQAENFEIAALTQLQVNDVIETGVTDVLLTNLDRDPALRLDVEFHHPPASGAYGPDSGRPIEERNQYYQVIVHSAVDQVFSQLVYQGPLVVTVEAVGRMRTARSLFAGDVLHATSRDACQGIKFAGTGNTTLNGGDAYSDSIQGDACGGGGGPDSCVSATILGTGDVTITDGTVITAGEWDVKGTGDLTTIPAVPPETCQIPQEMPFVPLADCGDDDPANFRSYHGGSTTLQPGIYSNGIQITGKKTEVQLAPGMYCLDDDLIVTGGNFTGDGVFFYMRNGDVNLIGNAYINLKKAEVMFDAHGEHDFGGYLFYMPYDNDGVIQLGGGSDTEYSGTIFAPGPRSPDTQDKCILEGNGVSMGFQSNIVCYTIRITGGANITINYNDSQNAQIPPFIELAQ